MAGHIDVYLDVASLYSYLAFGHLLDNRELLAAHGVELDFHPMLLGAVNTATGNRPPWAVPAKEKYGRLYEFPRAIARFGQHETRPPKNFAQMNMTVLPSRALHFIKANYPRETFVAVFYQFFRSFWTPPNSNLTDPQVLAETLAAMPASLGSASPPSSSKPSGGATLFSAAEVEAIMQGAKSQEMKDELRRVTQEAIDRGAFGAPWLWVKNRAGVEEPFFGSDRFHCVWKFLGLPYQDVALLPPSAKKAEDRRAKL